MARVTVVNDNPDFLDLMREVLEGERYEATTIDGLREDVLDAVRGSRPELVILDVRLSSEGLLGWDLAQKIRRDREFEGLPVLLCSADLQALHDIEEELEGQRAVEVLPKPFGIDQLTDVVNRLLARSDRG